MNSNLKFRIRPNMVLPGELETRNRDERFYDCTLDEVLSLKQEWDFHTQPVLQNINRLEKDFEELQHQIASLESELVSNLKAELQKFGKYLSEIPEKGLEFSFWCANDDTVYKAYVALDPDGLVRLSTGYYDSYLLPMYEGNSDHKRFCQERDASLPYFEKLLYTTVVEAKYICDALEEKIGELFIKEIEEKRALIKKEAAMRDQCSKLSGIIDDFFTESKCEENEEER